MRKPLVIGAAIGALALVGGGTGIAIAESPAPTTTTIDAPQQTGQQQTEQGGTISREQAVSTAQSKVPNAKVTEAGLDHENGKRIWEVDLENPSTEYEVDVDAANGQVLKVDQDDNDGDSDKQASHSSDNHSSDSQNGNGTQGDCDDDDD